MDLIRKAGAAAWLAAVAVMLLAAPAQAQNTTVRLTGSPPASMQFGGYTMPLCVNLGVDSLASGSAMFLPCNSSGQLVTSGSGGSSAPTSNFQGTLALSANTSTAVSTLTLSNSTTFPAAIGKLVIINVGAATGYICWFGGTCSATGGSEPLAAGASDTLYLDGATTSPTAFSTAGTTLAVHN